MDWLFLNVLDDMGDVVYAHTRYTITLDVSLPCIIYICECIQLYLYYFLHNIHVTDRRCRKNALRSIHSLFHFVSDLLFACMRACICLSLSLCVCLFDVDGLDVGF